MIKEKVQPTGKLHVKLTGPNGVVKKEFDVKNVVVNDGKDFIASKMAGGAEAVMGWMQIGTGSTGVGSELATNTQLVTPAAVVALDTSGGVVAANVVTFDATFGAGVGTGTINEAGIWNAADAQVSGTLLCRTTFGDVTKGADDTLSITWTVTIS